MGRPVIGIIACNRQLGPEAAQSVINRYVVASLTYAECSGLIVPALPDLVDAADVAARLDALLLTGSPSNVAPARYGDDDPGAGPFDSDRDEMTARLTRAMLDRGRPVFGICRGFQELNVVLGGTLRRDVSADGVDLPHHAPAEAELDAMFAHTHPVTLTPGGVLSGLYGDDTLTVNSVHYQGIDQPAPGLVVEARAADGLIEAFSATVNNAPVVAVQWHPEWRTQDNPASRDWFAMLGRAARGNPLIETGRTDA